MLPKPIELHFALLGGSECRNLCRGGRSQQCEDEDGDFLSHTDDTSKRYSRRTQILKSFQGST